MRSWFVSLCATTALIQAVYAAVRVMISYRALEMGGDATTIGILTALYSLVPLVAAMSIGRAVDGRRASAVLRSGSALAVVAVAVIALSDQMGVLGIGCVLLGFSHILTMVASQGYIPARAQQHDYDRRFGWLTVWISVGQAVGIPIVGILASEGAAGAVDTTTALVAMAGVALVATAISMLPSLRLLAPTGRDLATDERQSATTMLTVAGMRPAVFSSLIILTSMDLMTAYLPVFGQSHGYSVTVVTAILTVRALAAILSRALLTQLLNRVPRSWLLVSGSLCSAIPIALIPLIPDPIVVGALLAVAGFFWGLAQPLTMTWVAGLVTPSNRASALSLRLTGNRLGQVAIPLAAGVIAGSAGTTSIFLITSGLLAGAAASTWRSLYRSSRP